jgi:hypothetical protein
MKADSNYFHVYAILIFNYNLYEVGYDEEGESKLEDEDGDEDCLTLIFQIHYLAYSVD